MLFVSPLNRQVKHEMRLNRTQRNATTVQKHVVSSQWSLQNLTSVINKLILQHLRSNTVQQRKTKLYSERSNQGLWMPLTLESGKKSKETCPRSTQDTKIKIFGIVFEDLVIVSRWSWWRLYVQEEPAHLTNLGFRIRYSPFDPKFDLLLPILLGSLLVLLSPAALS